MTTVLQDLRSAVRNLLVRPGITLLTLLCLGLGIGANTAAFSFVNEFFIHRLPIEAPQEVVRIYNSYSHGFEYGELSYAELADYRERAHSFKEFIGESFRPMSLRNNERNERIYGSVVTGNYFDALGVRPALGRAFRPEEDRVPGAHAVAVISHGLWERRYGSDPSVLGRTVTVNGVQLTVIGVAPRGFSGTLVGLSPEVWIPTMMLERLRPGSDPFHSRTNRQLFALARLAPGVSLEQARADMNGIARQIKTEHPEDLKSLSGMTVIEEKDGTFYPTLRGPVVAFLTLLMAIVSLVLLIACANVAGLLIARATERAREMGIRQVLGASRTRLLRQLLTESSLLALLSAAFGLLLAWGVGRLVLSLTPPSEFPLSFSTRMDGYVLGFTLLVSFVTVFLFGLIPALQASRPDLVTAVKNETSSNPAKRIRLRTMLVVGQVALSVLLLVCSTLFVRSLQNASQIDVGFDPESVAVASVDLSLHGYDEVRGETFFRDALDKLRNIAGAESASLVERLPFAIEPQRIRSAPEGYSLPADGSMPVIDYTVVSPGYVDTMRMSLVRGRDFRDSDDADAPRVALINEELARKFWPGEDPIGKRLQTVKEFYEVIGIVRTAKYGTLGEAPLPYIYLAFAQNYRHEMSFVLRAARNPDQLLKPLRAEIESLDPDLILFNAMPLRERLRIAFLPAQMGAYVFGTFGLLALFLAMIGLYGILSYSVRQRTREIGIRMALGAAGGRVAQLVVGQGMKMILMGVVLGLLLAFAVTRSLASLLYGVSTWDPLAFGGTTVILVLIGLLACFLPVLRAVRLDPIVALRYG